MALPWLVEPRQPAWCQKAYSRYRRAGDDEQAAWCAIWLCLTYKANFSNFTAANGWLQRADRLLSGSEPGALRGWSQVARAYRMPHLDQAERLTEQAVEVARAANDVDLELVALSQLGLIRVDQGNMTEGFALIDEATAAALGGEPPALDTVVYTCCDMLRACELAGDLERAAQWCQVADDFVRTYGCPFLYAECRIFYGSVLAAKGRWAEAERELGLGVRSSEHSAPGCTAEPSAAWPAFACARAGSKWPSSSWPSGPHRGGRCRGGVGRHRAAPRAGRCGRGRQQLAPRLSARPTRSPPWVRRPRTRSSTPCLATGDVQQAAAASARLAAAAAGSSNNRIHTLVDNALGRVAAARGSIEEARARLNAALSAWSSLQLPYEQARARFDLGGALLEADRVLALDHAHPSPRSLRGTRRRARR